MSLINDRWNANVTARGVTITPLLAGPLFFTLEDLRAMFIALIAEKIEQARVDPVPATAPYHGAEQEEAA